MVSGILSLTRNGLRDWIIQRATSVVLAAYFIYLLVYFLLHPQLVYIQWVLLFESSCFRIFSLLALASLLLHAWVGVWTVITDYVKCTCLKMTLQLLLILSLLTFFFVGLEIIWGIY